ncbi:DUF3035 domain-containing protein [Sphingomonas quercus]|uniref:DUF3035 domain-containing protein n=1 Tax=Sphingomonas quercus TaxID=2842451 RepID=A0ABS6BJ90_9SPHN|nr:DUF3035 domain-containing protein [Sphingomonas quercus]MBU3077289.1 DUF3035 domain-containing protein [Sphingomonas quercus]
MRKVVVVVGLVAAAGTLASCGGHKGGVFAGRAGPDELAVSRQQPLVIPPDFNLVPPRPGAPRPQEADSSTQALQAMFGGQAQRSETEKAVLSAAGAGRAEEGIRSTAGDPATETVNKGQTTRDILNAPAAQGKEATVQTGQQPK